MAGILTGQAVVAEHAPAVRALLAGHAAVVEYAPVGRALSSGHAAVVEYTPPGKAVLAGTCAIPEYLPYMLVLASDIDTSGRALSSASMLFGRKFTGQRRKNKRDS